MHNDIDAAQFLSGQAANSSLHIGSQEIFLRVCPTGAELSAILVHEPTHQQIMERLLLGFSSAIHFDAGLTLSSDGEHLLLTQWVPDATCWQDVSRELENLLNQIAFFLENSDTKSLETKKTNDRKKEQLMRQLIVASESETVV